MTTNTSSAEPKPYPCETRAIRRKAESNPESLMARLWRWHTGWCLGWKACQAHQPGLEPSRLRKS